MALSRVLENYSLLKEWDSRRAALVTCHTAFVRAIHFRADSAIRTSTQRVMTLREFLEEAARAKQQTANSLYQVLLALKLDSSQDRVNKLLSAIVKQHQSEKDKCEDSARFIAKLIEEQIDDHLLDSSGALSATKQELDRRLKEVDKFAAKC
jgi:hypothetical protein